MEGNGAVWEEIKKLHQRYERKLNKLAADDYHEAVKPFHSDLVIAAIKNLRKHSKSLPTPFELEQECVRMKKYFDSQQPRDTSVVRCEYRSENESVLSRDRCQSVTQEWVMHSRNQGWPPLCDWHYACMYAKAFPGSSTAMMVKSVLKLSLRQQQLGIEMPRNSRNIVEAARSLSSGHKGSR